MWTVLGVAAVCLAPLACAETAPLPSAAASTGAQGRAARGTTAVRPASRGSLPNRLRRSVPGATATTAVDAQRGNRQLPARGHHTTPTAVLAGGTRIGPLPCFVAPVGRCSARREQRRGICFEDEQQRHRRPITPLSARRPRDDEGSSSDRGGSWSEGEDDEGVPARRPGKAGTPMPRMVTWGLNSRSQPSARKALGSNKKTHTIVYVCEVCGSEHVQWVGRCPTCKEWNCVKPFKVRREQGSSPSRVSRAAAASVTAGARGVGGASGGDPEFSGLGGGAFGGSGGAGWLPEEGFAAPTLLSEVGEAEKQGRMPLPGTELPRVLGGGLVPGSMVMLGGDPGVGKSTLLLQLAGQLASSQAGALEAAYEEEGEEEETDEGYQEEAGGEAGEDGRAVTEAERCRAGTVVYISGEENNSQVAARAKRMGIGGVDLFLYCETDIDVIIDQMLVMQPQPTLVMVDSIQTMRTQDSTSSPGSVTQVKECASRLVRLAKGSGITVFIVGHVTKSGSIAGPKVVEHMVDTVLYLEGDRFNSYRLLRSVKNRFGPSNEIGVFQMEAGGLDDVADPSMLFLSDKNIDDDDHAKHMDGSAVCVYMEGSRPILCELQSLVTYTRLPSPRRTSDGLPIPRLLLLLAVLQKRLGYDMSSREVYLNIVGGLKVQETAADLAVALAVVSSYTTIPVRPDTCFIGEIGLGGELRPVQQLPRRIQEAETFGFSRVVVPFTRKNRSARSRGGGRAGKAGVAAGVSEAGNDGRRGAIEVIECRNLKDAVAAGLTAVPKKRGNGSSRRSGGRGRGRFDRSSSSSSSEPEYGWQSNKKRQPMEDEGGGGGEFRESGFGVSSGNDLGDVEGFEGGWRDSMGDSGGYGISAEEEEFGDEWADGGDGDEKR
ncbi:unnamed protein product [Ectocarpus fasciculatus]